MTKFKKSREEDERRIVGIKGYEQYKNLEFKFSFEYPKNWKLKERSFTPDPNNRANPKGYGLWVLVQGPIESKSGVGYSGLDIWVVPTKEKNGGFSTLEEYAQDSIKNRSFGDTKIISNKETTLTGLNARGIVVSYETRRPLDAVKPITVISIDTWIIAKKDGYFFDLRFGSSEDDYPKYIEAYEHAKETFKFIE